MDGSEAPHEMKSEGPGTRCPIVRMACPSDLRIHAFWLGGQSDPCTEWQRLVSFWDQAAWLADMKTLPSVCQWAALSGNSVMGFHHSLLPASVNHWTLFFWIWHWVMALTPGQLDKGPASVTCPGISRSKEKEKEGKMTTTADFREVPWQVLIVEK